MSEHLLAVGSAVRKMPVVSITEGEDIGEIRDIIYDGEVGAVVGFTLNKRGFLSGRLDEVLPTQGVYAIGQEAVMVVDRSSLVDPASAEEAIARPETDRNVIGNDVLTESGTSLGTVVDVVLLTGPAFAGRAGDVVGYEVKLPAGGLRYIPLPVQVAVSGKALVVPDSTEEYICDGLAELSEAIGRFRARMAGERDDHPARPSPEDGDG